MKVGDTVKDTLTGSTWAITAIRQQGAGPTVWHELTSQAGAHRRVLTGELEERYRRVRGPA